ncbi:MAG TPA: carbohydrate kinase [Hanamia sp.]|nr:carbohydrate kinase [Hanamia sp.]
MKNIQNHKVVCFGEVLWDILPSGAVPGGAPMNVAYHLHKQNLDPAIITSVGNDKKGKELFDIFSGYGICTNFFQIDDQHETGKVYGKQNENKDMVYDIVKPVAWDYIKWENDFQDLVSHAEYFVFGSLAARSLQSKNTLLQLLECAKIKALDINLRPPHFNREIIEELLSKANFLKLNQEELELISGWFSKYTDLNDRAKLIRDKFHIQNMVVTRGGAGAVLFYNGKEFTHNGYKVNVVDTVGSGDAFLSGLIGKLMTHADPAKALDFASRLGAFIATKKGACPDYKMEDIETCVFE